MRHAHHSIDYVELHVDDVAAAKEFYGEVVEGPFDYPGGRRFHFHDPSGNRLGVFQPSAS